MVEAVVTDWSIRKYHVSCLESELIDGVTVGRLFSRVVIIYSHALEKL
jgi:hypothetical protein